MYCCLVLACECAFSGDGGTMSLSLCIVHCNTYSIFDKRTDPVNMLQPGM